MKFTTFVLAALILAATSFPAQAEDRPFDLRYYGSFKKILHLKLEGVAGLKEILAGSHLYAVGALAEGAGEITVSDSGVWLSYGKDGMDSAVRAIPEGEQALMVVTARVEKWKEVTVPNDMPEADFHQFVLAEAGRAGIDTGAPFPFQVDGPAKGLSWHVINGRNPEFRGHGGPHLMNNPPMKLLKERLERASATLIGFYSAGIQGEFTHPGESWHVHVLFRDENRAGHVDEVTIAEGALLKLPLNQ